MSKENNHSSYSKVIISWPSVCSKQCLFIYLFFTNGIVDPEFVGIGSNPVSGDLPSRWSSSGTRYWSMLAVDRVVKPLTGANEKLPLRALESKLRHNHDTYWLIGPLGFEAHRRPKSIWFKKKKHYGNIILI